MARGNNSIFFNAIRQYFRKNLINPVVENFNVGKMASIGTLMKIAFLCSLRKPAIKSDQISSTLLSKNSDAIFPLLSIPKLLNPIACLRAGIQAVKAGIAAGIDRFLSLPNLGGKNASASSVEAKIFKAIALAIPNILNVLLTPLASPEEVIAAISKTARHIFTRNAHAAKARKPFLSASNAQVMTRLNTTNPVRPTQPDNALSMPETFLDSRLRAEGIQQPRRQTHASSFQTLEKPVPNEDKKLPCESDKNFNHS